MLSFSVISGEPIAAGSTPAIVPVPTNITGVTVSPATVELEGDATAQFSAVVSGEDSPSQEVIWAVSSGQIDAGGLFTAPPATRAAQDVTITAASKVDRSRVGVARATVTAVENSPIVGAITPQITSAGHALFAAPALPGFQIALTHVAVGSARYAPDGSETALRGEIARFPIGAGRALSPTSLEVSASLLGQDPAGHALNDKWIGEIGFYAGSTLFAIWSRPGAYLFHKTADIDVPIIYVLDLSAVPADSVVVNVQIGAEDIQAVMNTHAGKPDPHPQYLSLDEATQLVHLHEIAPDPHPQYFSKTEGDAIFIKLHEVPVAEVLAAMRNYRARRFYRAAGM